MGKKILVKELIENFDLQIINRGNCNARYITSSGVARIGIELATDIKPAYKKQTNPVCFGTSELNYFIKANSKQIAKMVKRIKALDPPMIILNSAFKEGDIKHLMKAFGKTNITIAKVDMCSNDIYFEISPWISRKIAPSTIIHGTLMSIYGVGVLITGDSGTGKSEAAMELLKTGHMFVGDDAIEVYNFGHSIYGHPSNIAKQFIEVRGLGILDVSRMFGWQKTLQETQIDMAVHLVSPEESKKNLNNFERLGNKQQTEKVHGVYLAKYYIPIIIGRPTASLIESAVVDYKLKRAGYNSAENYLDNYDKILKEGEK